MPQKTRPRQSPAQRRQPTKSKAPPSNSFSDHPPINEDFLEFGRYILLTAFIWLTIAAIITTNKSLMVYSVLVGIVVAWGVRHNWFKP